MDIHTERVRYRDRERQTERGKTIGQRDRNRGRKRGEGHWSITRNQTNQELKGFKIDSRDVLMPARDITIIQPVSPFLQPQFCHFCLRTTFFEIKVEGILKEVC